MLNGTLQSLTGQPWAYDGFTHSQVQPALLREKAAARSWLWINPGSRGHEHRQKNIKSAPGCNLTFRKICLDKWIHLKTTKFKGLVLVAWLLCIMFSSELRRKND